MASSKTGGNTAVDRQRDRERRGVGSADAARSAQRVASPPKRRRPAVVLLGVLLIVGGAALAGLLALQLDSRDQVLALKTDVPAGTRITADMLTTTSVSSDSDLLLTADDEDLVVGTYAKVPLSAGQLVDTTMLVKAAPLANGAVAEVGVTLTSGRVPSDLRSGDLVRIVQLSDGSRSMEPLAVGIVLSVSTENQDSGLISSGGQALGTATLLVPESAADRVVNAAGTNSFGLALIDRGVSLDDLGQLAVLGGAMP